MKKSPLKMNLVVVGFSAMLTATAMSQPAPVEFGTLPVVSRFEQVSAYSVDPQTLVDITPDTPGVELVPGRDGKAVQFEGHMTMVSKRAYRIDPDKRYRLAADVRAVKEDPAKGGVAGFLGVMTYGEDGTLLEGGPGTHRYAGWSGKIIEEGDWQRVEGEITGEGNETMYQFRPDTAYVRIVAIMNYESPEAVSQLDNLVFEEVR